MNAASDAGHVCRVSVGFIQVCRNSVRSYGKSWKSLADQNFLKHVYESGTAFYVYPGCQLIDLVIPMRVETGTQSTFAPMLVSIKCRSTFSRQEANAECDKMQKRATANNLEKALCLLVVFGCESIPQSQNLAIENVSDALINGVNGVVSNAIFVPHDDYFGLSKAFKAMTPTAQVYAELLASHPFIMAHGANSEELNSSKAMRAISSKASLAEYDRLRKAMTIDCERKKEGSDELQM